MNQIEYAVSLQRILAIASSIAFFSLCLVLIFTSPFVSPVYIWLVLFLLWLILSSIFSLIGYWWVFSIRKEIISILEANLVVSKSSFLALSLVYLLTNYNSKSINFWLVISLFLLNISFFYYIRSYGK
jgi:hypothetical protein